jgi:hypothetical protein
VPSKRAPPKRRSAQRRELESLRFGAPFKRCDRLEEKIEKCGGGEEGMGGLPTEFENAAADARHCGGAIYGVRDLAVHAEQSGYRRIMHRVVGGQEAAGDVKLWESLPFL